MTRCSLKAPNCHYCGTVTKLCQGSEFFEMKWKCPKCKTEYNLLGEEEETFEISYDIYKTLKESLLLCLKEKDYE